MNELAMTELCAYIIEERQLITNKNGMTGQQNMSMPRSCHVAYTQILVTLLDQD